jgi:DnaJ family protein C protein 7
MKLKKFSQALTDCNLSIECDDSYAKSYLRRGNIKEELDDYENAVYDYQKVQELDPSKRNYFKN